ncbi:MAG: hypothetical protein LBR89_00100 [Holosporales bacterium]|jgi:hypothetical protein|nr:hypothetical protein [Holosporales bacterium]
MKNIIKFGLIITNISMLQAMNDQYTGSLRGITPGPSLLEFDAGQSDPEYRGEHSDPISSEATPVYFPKRAVASPVRPSFAKGQVPRRQSFSAAPTQPQSQPRRMSVVTSRCDSDGSNDKFEHSGQEFAPQQQSCRRGREVFSATRQRDSDGQDAPNDRQMFEHHRQELMDWRTRVDFHDLRSLRELIDREGAEQLRGDLANDSVTLSRIMSLSQSDPSQLSDGVQCLRLLDQAVSTVAGMAPPPVHIAYQSLKYAAIGVSKLVQMSKNKMVDVRSGKWRNSSGNNIAHLASKNYSPRLMSWCVVNCEPQVFVQLNNGKFTPRDVAMLRRTTFQEKYTQCQAHLTELENKKRKHDSDIGRSSRKYVARIGIAQSQVSHAEKRLSCISSVISILDRVSEMKRMLALNDMDRAPAVSEIYDLSSVNAMEALALGEEKMRDELASISNELIHPRGDCVVLARRKILDLIRVSLQNTTNIQTAFELLQQTERMMNSQVSASLRSDDSME